MRSVVFFISWPITRKQCGSAQQLATLTTTKDKEDENVAGTILAAGGKVSIYLWADLTGKKSTPQYLPSRKSHRIDLSAVVMETKCVSRNPLPSASLFTALPLHKRRSVWTRPQDFSPPSCGETENGTSANQRMEARITKPAATRVLFFLHAFIFSLLLSLLLTTSPLIKSRLQEKHFRS